MDDLLKSLFRLTETISSSNGRVTPRLREHARAIAESVVERHLSLERHSAKDADEKLPERVVMELHFLTMAENALTSIEESEYDVNQQTVQLLQSAADELARLTGCSAACEEDGGVADSFSPDAEDWINDIFGRICQLVIKYDARPRFRQVIMDWVGEEEAKGHTWDDCLCYGPDTSTLPGQYAFLAAFHDHCLDYPSVYIDPLSPVEFRFTDDFDEFYKKDIHTGKRRPRADAPPPYLCMPTPNEPPVRHVLEYLLAAVENDLASWSTDKSCTKIQEYVQQCDLLTVARLWDYFRGWPTREDCLRLHHANGMDERQDVLHSMLDKVQEEFPALYEFLCVDSIIAKAIEKYEFPIPQDESPVPEYPGPRGDERYQEYLMFRLPKYALKELAGVADIADKVLWSKDCPKLEQVEAALRSQIFPYNRSVAQEALVYLVSRKGGFKAEIEGLRGLWQAEVNAVTERFVEAKAGKVILQEARDVSRWPSSELPHFWDHQDLTTTATMLRIARTCKITGFEKWWRRYADEFEALVADGKFDAFDLSCQLFSLCRANKAFELEPLVKAMRMALLRICGTGAIEDRENPWRVMHKEAIGEKTYDSVSVAAAILFGACRIPGAGIGSDMLMRAAEFLMESQGPCGAWVDTSWCLAFPPGDETGEWFEGSAWSFEASAMAVHALCLFKPKGYEVAVAGACEWFWKLRSYWGFWPAPVMVLDAISMAEGDGPITFTVRAESGGGSAGDGPEIVNDVGEQRGDQALPTGITEPPEAASDVLRRLAGALRAWAEANKGNRASSILVGLTRCSLTGATPSEDDPAKLKDIMSHIHELRRKVAEAVVDAYPLLAWCATNLACPAGPVSKFVETALQMKQQRDAGEDWWATRFDGQFSRYRNRGPRSFDDTGAPVEDVPTAVAMEVADHIDKWASKVADKGGNIPFAPEALSKPLPKRVSQRHWQTIAEVEKHVGRFAPTDCSILLLGETGTGKEFYAKKVHQASSRKSGPFIVVNCATLPKERIDSELFGHVKGAFTGAVQDSPGKIALAWGGIVFLDEIGELPPECWGNLLRFLQDKEIHPVGGKTAVVDVRILAATNKTDRVPPDALHRFDLTLSLPPLRARSDDIPGLAREFFQDALKTSGRALRFQRCELASLGQADYDWPGNIRQLRKAIRGAVILHAAGRDVTCQEVLEAAKSITNLT